MIPIRLARSLVAVVIEPLQKLALTKGLTLKNHTKMCWLEIYLLRIPVFLNSRIISLLYISCSTIGTTVHIYLMERLIKQFMQFNDKYVV
jgi:hypothetical protein